MFKSLVLFVALFLSNVAVHSQSTIDSPCYEILHLDFFGLLNIEEFPKWPKSETDGLKEMILKRQEKDSSLVLGMPCPFIVYQLQEFHPYCLENPDTSYLARIIELYRVIRQFDKAELKNFSLIEQIDFIRDDFYELVKDDENLLEMSFILDDGPFYGVDYDRGGSVTESIKTNFGKLEISQLEGQGVLSALDKKDNVIWRKAITGLGGRELGEISSAENHTRETSLATIFSLYAGERLTLYVKNDGTFMYYFHSW